MNQVHRHLQDTRAMQDTVIHSQHTTHTFPNLRTAFAIFDYDGTLVKPKDGRAFPKDVHDWQYTRPSVRDIVRRYEQTHHIVIVTDQSKLWKIEQIKAVVCDLGVQNITVVIGVQTQKPSTLLFHNALPSFQMAESAFYVGDAAGRPGDWSDRDRVFAQNLNVVFRTPEEMFPLDAAIATQADVGVDTIRPSSTKEVVIMVGYPASGKSTIVRGVFEQAHYHCVNGDVLKTTAAMIKDAEKHIARQSVVFDSTAGRKAKREAFVHFAKKHNVPVRACWVNTPIDVSMERNKQRAADGAHRIPDVAFYVYRKHFDTPEESEGFRLVTLLERPLTSNSDDCHLDTAPDHRLVG